MLPIVQLDAKVCKKCGIEKPIAQFYSIGKWTTNRCHQCKAAYFKSYRDVHKDALDERARGWYRKNKELVKQRSRDGELFRNFGLTRQEYNRLFQIQGGTCRICGVHQMFLTHRLHVDHCHRTKVVRGLLCHNCNIAMGLLKENRLTLEKMIEYLRGNH